MITGRYPYSRGDDVIASASNGGDGQELGSLAGRGRDRSNTSLELGNSLLEDVYCGVANARVDVSESPINVDEMTLDS